MARITLIGPAYPYRGGLAAFNERLTIAFRDGGHEADLLTFTVQYPSLLFPGRSQVSNRPRPEIPIQRRVHSLNPLNWFQVGLHLRKQRPDVLIFKFWLPFMAPCFGTIARLARANRHTCVAGILDNVIPHEHRPGDRQLTGYFLNSCDRLFVMSEQVRADLKHFRVSASVQKLFHPSYDYGPPVSREVALKHLGLETDYRYALFFGFIRPYKGLDLLLQAMAEEGLKDGQLKLLVAGEFYEPSQPYFALVRRLGLEHCVIFHDRFIEDDQVASYFCGCDFVVLPYREATQSGIAQIAFRYGRPVIATRVGGLPEVIDNGATGLIAEASPASLAAAMLRLLHPETLQRMTEAVSRRHRADEWQRFARELLASCLNMNNSS